MAHPAAFAAHSAAAAAAARATQLAAVDAWNCGVGFGAARTTGGAAFMTGGGGGAGNHGRRRAEHLRWRGICNHRRRRCGRRSAAAAWNTCAGGAFATTGGGGVRATDWAAAGGTPAPAGHLQPPEAAGCGRPPAVARWNTCAGGTFAIAGGDGGAGGPPAAALPATDGEVGAWRIPGGVVCWNVAPGALWNCGDSRVTIAGVAPPLPRLTSGGICEPAPWPAKPGSRCIAGGAICPGAGARSAGVAVNGRTDPAAAGRFGCAGLCNVGSSLTTHHRRRGDAGRDASRRGTERGSRRDRVQARR